MKFKNPSLNPKILYVSQNLSTCISLVGMMGVGKTTLGKELSSVINKPFIDLDKEIEVFEEMSISQIFSKKGEDYFRNTETKVLDAIFKCNTGGFILSLGGGTPCFNGNMDLINNNSISFLLNAEPKFVLSRLKGDKTRPILDSLSEKEKLAKITNIISEREYFYNKAKYKIDVIPSANVVFYVECVVDNVYNYLNLSKQK
jgi:shikimate kinase